ncbi:MAG: hypothetical protein AB4372_06015 [Xenococcus sp. (in: cyanobacteria)]
MQNTILEENLEEEEEEETLNQLQSIAQALQNTQDGSNKKIAKRAMRVIRGIAAGLYPSASMVTICNQLSELIAKIF